MPSVYDLKPRFQRLLRPLAGALARAGVTANQVTVAAVALSAAGGAAIALAPGERWPLLALPAVLFVRMALNAVDGMLAREHGQASRLGAVLNELGDVVSDALLYLPLALVPAIPAGWMVAAVVVGSWTEVAGLVSVQIGGTRRYDGPLGKSDRAVIFSLIAVAVVIGYGATPDEELAAIFTAFGGTPPTWVELILPVVVLFSLVTVVQRVRRGLAEARAAEAGAPPSSRAPRRAPDGTS